jgi:hypothetical protein
MRWCKHIHQAWLRLGLEASALPAARERHRAVLAYYSYHFSAWLFDTMVLYEFYY